jgi:hypothetical protein
MSESPEPMEGQKGGRNPRGAGSWAVGRNVLRVSYVPAGAVNLNASLRPVVYTMFAQVRKASGLIHRSSRS